MVAIFVMEDGFMKLLGKVFLWVHILDTDPKPFFIPNLRVTDHHFQLGYYLKHVEFKDNPDDIFFYLDPYM